MVFWNVDWMRAWLWIVWEERNVLMLTVLLQLPGILFILFFPSLFQPLGRCIHCLRGRHMHVSRSELITLGAVRCQDPICLTNCTWETLVSLEESVPVVEYGDFRRHPSFGVSDCLCRGWNIPEFGLWGKRVVRTAYAQTNCCAPWIHRVGEPRTRASSTMKDSLLDASHLLEVSLTVEAEIGSLTPTLAY
jgi:hypothetical protein